MADLLTVAPRRETKYLTRKGDTVDSISFLHYGEEKSDLVNAIFRRNFKVLMNLPAVLPVGVIIHLPLVKQRVDVVTPVQIWITPSNQAALRLAAEEQAAAEVRQVQVASPTQEEIDTAVLEYQLAKIAGTIPTPPSVPFVTGVYERGEDGIQDPFIPSSDTVLNLV